MLAFEEHVMKVLIYFKDGPTREFINLGNFQGQTALHYCFAYGYMELGNYLISLGADETLENRHGMTCYDGLEPNGVEPAALQTPAMRHKQHMMRQRRWAGGRAEPTRGDASASSPWPRRRAPLRVGLRAHQRPLLSAVPTCPRVTRRTRTFRIRCCASRH